MTIALTRPEAAYLRDSLQGLVRVADDNPGSIGHLAWRAPVAEMLEALQPEDAETLTLTVEQAKTLGWFLASVAEKHPDPAPNDFVGILIETLSAKLYRLMIDEGLMEPPEE